MTEVDCSPGSPGLVAPAGRISLEFFPARGQHQLANNVIAVRQLLKSEPDFVTVTYGASGSVQHGSFELVRWLVDAGVDVYAHLTCYARSREQLVETVVELLDIGVAGILAIRGDAPDGESAHRRVVPHASDLVKLVRRVADERGRSVEVAVAAFPAGHPESRDLGEDARTLRRKQDAGASFAITQNVFGEGDYARFLPRAERAGVTIPIIPGVIVPTTVRQLVRMSALSGVDVPGRLADRLSRAGSPEERVEIAVDHTVDLVERLVRVGAPGVQLFTMNHAPASLRVVRRLRAQQAEVGRGLATV